MTRNDIDQIYTAKIAELLAQGYQIHTNAMGGSQGDLAHIDLQKGSEILRVLLDSTSSYGTSYGDFYTITVGRNTDTLTGGWHDIIWNEHLEKISEIKFVKITNTYFTTPEAAQPMAEKREQRWRSQRRLPKRLGDAYKAVALKYVKRQPRMKTCRISDIDWVLRKENPNGSVCYEIQARGTRFLLRSPRA